MTDITAAHPPEKERLHARHPFVAMDGADRGYCGGPFCILGVVSREEHAAHVADAHLAISPGTE